MKGAPALIQSVVASGYKKLDVILECVDTTKKTVKLPSMVSGALGCVICKDMMQSPSLASVVGG